MKRTLLAVSILISATFILPGIAVGQRETATGIEIDKNIELMRKNLRSEMKQIIAANLPLTETEATKFWPVYDQFTADYAKINDKFYGLIKDYAANQKTLTDAKALELIKQWGSIQLEIAQLRQRAIPAFEKVISGRKVAHFFQINRRLWSLLDLQVASEIPLVLQ
jgi:1-aminocyclopropane-1-carboxylate deaminase/D-cysteine desulfhydrase-like pyridoxal-dependent ACC family enzyme